MFTSCPRVALRKSSNLITFWFKSITGFTRGQMGRLARIYWLFMQQHSEIIAAGWSCVSRARTGQDWKGPVCCPLSPSACPLRRNITFHPSDDRDRVGVVPTSAALLCLPVHWSSDLLEWCHSLCTRTQLWTLKSGLRKQKTGKCPTIFGLSSHLHALPRGLHYCIAGKLKYSSWSCH